MKYFVKFLYLFLDFPYELTSFAYLTVFQVFNETYIHKSYKILLNLLMITYIFGSKNFKILSSCIVIYMI